MILQIKIPQEFEQDYIGDRFEDFFGRVIANIDSNINSNEEIHMCGKYEKEIAEMFIKVFSNAKYIKDVDKPKRKEKIMTIKQYIKKIGWPTVIDIPDDTVCMDVDIGFINDNHQEDETEFTIRIFDGVELSELYSDFCDENNFPKDTVEYLEIVRFYNQQDIDDYC